MTRSRTNRLFITTTFAVLLIFGLLSLGACATQPAVSGNIGTITKAAANPDSAGGDVYLVQADAVSARVSVLRPAGGVSLPHASSMPNRTGRVRIVAFNDLHNALTLPNATRGDTHVFSQMALRVSNARKAAAQNEAVLFLSAGDDHTGSLFDELVGADAASFILDPAYRAYSRAGLDASVVGNHELDRGARLLAREISSDARFPVLSANLTGSRVLSPGLVPCAALVVRSGIRVAVVGLTTPDETVIRAADDPGLKFADPLMVLDNLIPAMQENADMIVVLSHVGYDSVGADARHDVKVGDRQIARELARLTRLPAVVIGGHTHTVLNKERLDRENIVDGVPVFQAGGQGSYYEEIVVDVKLAAGRSEGTVTESSLVPIKRRDDRVKQGDQRYAALEHDADFDSAFESAIIAPMLSRLKDRMTESVGRLDAGTDVSAEQTLSDRYVAECAAANFMNDAVVSRSATFPGGKVDIAVFNASGVAGGFPAADRLTFADMFALMPYADVIFIAQLTGEQLKQIIRSNAKRIVRPEELAGAKPLDLRSYISRGFLHFSRAVRYTVARGADVDSAEAVDITVNGTPVEQLADKTFRVVFSSYIAGGGEGWSGKSVGAGLPEKIVGYDIRSVPKQDTGLIYRNEIIDFVRSITAVGPATGAAKDGRLRVVP